MANTPSPTPPGDILKDEMVYRVLCQRKQAANTNWRRVVILPVVTGIAYSMGRYHFPPVRRTGPVCLADKPSHRQSTGKSNWTKLIQVVDSWLPVIPFWCKPPKQNLQF